MPKQPKNLPANATQQPVSKQAGPTASPDPSPDRAARQGAARQGSPSLPAKAIQQPVSKQAGSDATSKKVSVDLVGVVDLTPLAETDHDPPKPTKREIISARLGCAPDELLVYREGDRRDDPLGRLIVAIAPDGRKFKFSAVDLTPIS